LPEDEDSSSDLIKFWGLDKKSRFPVTPEDWDAFIQFPVRQRTKNVGLHDYDLRVNRKARRPLIGAIAKLFAAFRGDFETASQAFTPVQWRLLFHLDQYPLANLANPSFDAVETLLNICGQENWKMEVPSEWTGSIVPSIVLLQDLPIEIRQLDADVAKAVWTILAFARILGLVQNDVLQVSFWQPWWIERCLAAISRRDSQESRPHFPHAASVGPQSVRAAGLKRRGQPVTSRGWPQPSKARPIEQERAATWTDRFLWSPIRSLRTPVSSSFGRLRRLFKPGDLEELF